MVNIHINIFINIILIFPFLFPHVVIISCLALTDDADHLHCEEECYIPGHQEKIFHPTYKWLIYNWHDWLQFYLDTSSAAYGLLLVINELRCLYSTQFEIWKLNFENWILKIEFWIFKIVYYISRPAQRSPATVHQLHWRYQGNTS